MDTALLLYTAVKCTQYAQYIFTQGQPAGRPATSGPRTAPVAYECQVMQQMKFSASSKETKKKAGGCVKSDPAAFEIY